MWDFPTSMRPVLRRAAVVAVVAVAVGAGFAGGWFVRSATSTSSLAAATVSVVAAGSLAPILPGFLSAFANATPGTSAPLSAQLYEGSAAAAAALSVPRPPYDLFVAADFRVIPQLLEPPAGAAAGWEIVFAADPLVLAFNAKLPALAGINASNWYAKIVGPGITLGAPNASVDPLGFNVLFALELEDALAGLNGSLYRHFFDGAPGSFATPAPATKYVPENTAASALTTGEVSVYLIYASYARAERLAYVPLDPRVNLGAYDPANVSRYGTASTTISSANGSTTVVRGAPVLFALTVPVRAPNSALGLALANYLLSNASASRWTADGFVRLVPGWTDEPGRLPAAMSGSPPQGVPPLPAYLAARLAG
jgi:ABC-type molybdate transport system substrate-binding protein